ncbi:MAG: putative nucleic-acid-binding protein containing a Zn-ribbon [Rhodobacteraceae bacterium HLUCCA12]|nr:MAG: putative nucleic-acid-binding protein containing a Zn-ribbon [Rhodobacteraceae bacterium HLUCCA12]
MAQQRVPTTPTTNHENRAFWEAADEQQFMIGHCRACNEPHFYPRALCPFCFSDETELRQASGEGHIYAVSVMRRAPVPYALAYVTLAEGPVMMTNIVNCDFDALAIGQAVEVTFQASEDGTKVPVFQPV